MFYKAEAFSGEAIGPMHDECDMLGGIGIKVHPLRKELSGLLNPFSLAPRSQERQG